MKRNALRAEIAERETVQERMARTKITPMEKMILEVLIARHRLGHYEWAIETNPTTMRMLGSLQRKGFVIWRHYVTPNSVRARLTCEAKVFLMDHIPYVPPIMGGPQ